MSRILSLEQPQRGLLFWFGECKVGHPPPALVISSSKLQGGLGAEAASAKCMTGVPGVFWRCSVVLQGPSIHNPIWVQGKTRTSKDWPSFPLWMWKMGCLPHFAKHALRGQIHTRIKFAAGLTPRAKLGLMCVLGFRAVFRRPAEGTSR